MKLSIRFGDAETEEVEGGRRIVGVVGDFQDPLVYARSSGKTIGYSPAVQCEVVFDPGESGVHVLSASMRSADGRPIGQEQRKHFEPPEYGVFPYMFWWPDASLPPGEYLIHVSLDGRQIKTRTLRVLPHELDPRRIV
mgnify:CR=1 FL=1